MHKHQQSQSLLGASTLSLKTSLPANSTDVSFWSINTEQVASNHPFTTQLSNLVLYPIQPLPDLVRRYRSWVDPTWSPPTLPKWAYAHPPPSNSSDERTFRQIPMLLFDQPITFPFHTSQAIGQSCQRIRKKMVDRLRTQYLAAAAKSTPEEVFTLIKTLKQAIADTRSKTERFLISGVKQAACDALFFFQIPSSQLTLDITHTRSPQQFSTDDNSQADTFYSSRVQTCSFVAIANDHQITVATSSATPLHSKSSTTLDYFP
ncbi:hypothetical protein BLNAU_2500 [Blattamonas nauphoetae]|uniref:Uncharacterized protein n=1 Tax=Blattamonas nauphoetae TaxID=2049346 RepID=A0ABQ9YFX2_9EUKA|nr:hypothetical protein BLNAU_2500 [Blattamonas nauphoetae]